MVKTSADENLKDKKSSKKVSKKNLKKDVKNKSKKIRKKTSDSSKTSNKTKDDAEHKLTLGQRGEKAAYSYLKNKGYEVIARNWRCKLGEADIVALYDDTIVFVEVKTRSNLEIGLPEDSVDAKKRKKYECIAGMFLRDHDYVDMSVRFDVIAILSCGENKAMLRHHINAFGVA